MSDEFAVAGAAYMRAAETQSDLAEAQDGRADGVSIIIVSYNTREMALTCLESVYAQTRQVDFSVIVVDNASRDGSADAISERFSKAELIRLKENVGFAAANNIAAHRSRHRWLLLLNPDTLVLDGAVDALLAFARAHPEHGIFGGRTLFADGSLNPSSCWGRPTLRSMVCRMLGVSSLFRGNRLLDPESLGGWRRDSVREVDIVTGCLLLIRRDLWNRLGGFDEQFFMYGEDADLCLRAHALGARPMVTPDATIVHHGGASEPVRIDKRTKLLAAKCLLMRKHWSPAAARIGVWCLLASTLHRAIALKAASFLTRSHAVRQASESWTGVWRLRRGWSAPTGLEYIRPRLCDAGALRNYLETPHLTDSDPVQDAREGGQDGPDEAEGEGAADDLAVPR